MQNLTMSDSVDAQAIQPVKSQELSSPPAASSESQKLQYPLFKEYSLNHSRDPTTI